MHLLYFTAYSMVGGAIYGYLRHRSSWHHEDILITSFLWIALLPPVLANYGVRYLLSRQDARRLSAAKEAAQLKKQVEELEVELTLLKG